MENETQVKIRSMFTDKIQSEERFKRLDDGWVRDSLTGLDWGSSSKKVMTFIEAEEYCKKLGGRLPEINELHSLVDYRNMNPAANKDIFSDTKCNDWYWSCTVFAGLPEYRWCVLFSSGSVFGFHQDRTNYVRPCRPSQ